MLTPAATVTANAWNTYTVASSDFVNNLRLLFPDWSILGIYSQSMARVVAGVKVMVKWKGEGMLLGLCRVRLQNVFENGSKGRGWICCRRFLVIMIVVGG